MTMRNWLQTASCATQTFACYNKHHNADLKHESLLQKLVQVRGLYPVVA